jgi:hypothetical protein
MGTGRFSNSPSFQEVLLPQNLDVRKPENQDKFRQYAQILCDIVAGGTVYPMDPNKPIQTDWQLGTSNNWWFGTRDELSEKPVLRCRYSTDTNLDLMGAAIQVFYLRCGFPS